MMFESFEKEYEMQEREYLVLMSDESTWSMGGKSYVVAQAPFLAYIDTETDELKHGDGRLSWPMKNKEEKAGKYFNRFQKGGIYHIKACKLIDTTVPEGRLASFYNNLYVKEVLAEKISNPILEGILAEYRKPVILQDEVLGELILNKDLGLFNGSIEWLETKTRITLDVDKDSKTSWTKARNAMKKFLTEQQKWDIQMRRFAADKLTALANEWQDEENEDAPDISEEDFAKRISIQDISMTSGGSFSVYFDDDDMFWGHTVTVDGTLRKGITNANMEG